MKNLMFLFCISQLVGLFADRKLDERYARRDAMLVHYMKTHPEDFPVEGD